MKIAKLLPLFLCLPWQMAAQEVQKSQWIEGMTTALPAAFCQSQQYFRQCYRVTAKKCEEVATSATRLCLNKFSQDIPAKLKQPQDGQKWGATVGRCAGETYGSVLNKEFINSKECNDASRWTQ